MAPAARREVVSYLRAREQVNGVYRESWVPVWSRGAAQPVLALTYVVERAHPSYAGRLPFREQVRLIRAGRGLSGANVEYLANTAAHLAELGLRDRHLERLVSAIGGLFSSQREDSPGKAHALVSACRIHPPGAPRMPRYVRRRFIHRMQLDQMREAKERDR